MTFKTLIFSVINISKRQVSVFASLCFVNELLTVPLYLHRFREPEKWANLLVIFVGVRVSNSRCTSARFAGRRPIPSALRRNDSAAIGISRSRHSRQSRPCAWRRRFASGCVPGRKRRRKGKEESDLESRDREMSGKHGQRLVGITASSIRTIGAFRKFTAACVMLLSDISSPPASLVFSTWRRKRFSARRDPSYGWW